MPINVKMTSGQKVAFSFLFSLVLFAFAALLLHTSLFSEIEADFYSQSKIQEKTNQLDEISTSIENYIKDVLDLIEKGENPYIKNPSVRSYYVQNPAESDTVERRRLTEKLFYDVPELKGIRIVDRNARIVHFSTFDDTDILTQNGISKTYKNYPDIQKDANILDYELITKNSFEDKSKVLFDSERNEIVISIPFYWIDGIYSGAALFYIDFAKLKTSLADKNVIAHSQNFAMVSDGENLSGGFITNFPDGFLQQIKEKILEVWKNEDTSKISDADNTSFSLIRSKTFGVFDAPEKIAKLDDSHFLVVINSSFQNTFYFSGIYSSELFELTDELKLLIYISTFITIFLIIFLLFSFKRNPEMILQKRVKKLQLEIIEDYLEKQESLDFYEIVKKLKSRRSDLSSDILKSLNVHSKKKQKKLDEILNQSWDEIFYALGISKPETEVQIQAAGATQDNSALLAEIRKMLDEVLTEVSSVKKIRGITAAGIGSPAQISSATGTVSPTSTAATARATGSGVAEDLLVEDIEEIEDAEELDDAEPIEEIDDVEELDDAEAVEEIDDAEELDDAEPVEDIADAEELDDAEPVEEIEDAEELDDAEPVEDVGDAEEVDDAEPVEDIDGAEEVGDADPVEDIADAEELDDAEPVEDIAGVEEVDDAEPVEDIEDAEEVEELDGADDEESPDEADEKIKAQIMSLAGPHYEYHPDNESYFPGEDFATVDNLFAEPLGIGAGFIYNISKEKYDFTVFAPNFLAKEDEDTKTSLEPVEDELDVLEEVSEAEQKKMQQKKNKPYFSLTNFADNNYEELEDL